ncbi:MAG: FAD-binding oxidoreductase [Leptothrix sp. (in: b-proteobacteria)]
MTPAGTDATGTAGAPAVKASTGSPDALLTELRAALGADQVLCRDDGNDNPHPHRDSDLSGYEVDWRRRYHGRARAVLRPGTTAEVALVLRIAARHGASVVPQGGNTGLVGGGVPDGSGTQLLLSLRRLNRIRALDAANLTLTVEAGCVLQTAQQAAADAGLLLPLSLAAEGSCTIGGNLATNAGGVQVLRHGNTRELCLGLEVVTPDGEVWDGLRGLRKDNTGYDLRDLYIGSEGTLGVITAAVLKLQPQPRAVLTALATLASLADCVALLQRAHAMAGATLTAFEVMNAQSVALVRQHLPQAAVALPQAAVALPQAAVAHATPPSAAAAPAWTVLLELSDHEDEAHAQAVLERLLGAAIDAGEVNDAVVASSRAQSNAIWQLRESIPLAQAADGLNIKHDIALPISATPDFVAATDAALLRHRPGTRLVTFGHLGDGNLHYNVMAPLGEAPADFLREQEAAINAIVYDRVVACGGSISAEHGIGELKRDELARRQSPVAAALMRRIKQALDPQNRLNPGRVLSE